MLPRRSRNRVLPTSTESDQPWHNDVVVEWKHFSNWLYLLRLHIHIHSAVQLWVPASWEQVKMQRVEVRGHFTPDLATPILSEKATRAWEVSTDTCIFIMTRSTIFEEYVCSIIFTAHKCFQWFIRVLFDPHIWIISCHWLIGFASSDEHLLAATCRKNIQKREHLEMVSVDCWLWRHVAPRTRITHVNYI